MTTANTLPATANKKCTYCAKPMDTPVKREIIYRGYDPVRRKQVVKREIMEFCSPICGSSYQMGCEG